MRLTRRDVLAALTAAGVTAGAGSVILSSPDDGGEGGPIDDHTLATLTAAAFVLYPTEVAGVEQFVERYVRGRVAGRPNHEAGITAAVEYLDDYAQAWHGTRFAELEGAVRDDVLRGMSADTATPDRDGSDVERVRYYVVNELLFALYTSPTGGSLVGIENPPGHPGGLASYQRGPDGE